MKRPFVFVFGGIVGFLLLLLLAQDTLLKVVAENAFTRTTGFKTKIQDFHYQYPGAFHIQGLTFYNPAGFENKVFAECSRLFMIFNMPEFLRREGLHIYVMEMSLREINLEKTAAGLFNLELLKPSETRASFQLDKMQLTMKRVDYLDRSGEYAKRMSPNFLIEREDSGPFNSLQAVFGFLTGKMTEAIDA